MSIPYGFCHCGCGEKTNLADRTRPRLGHVKGEPMKWIVGHHTRGKTFPKRPLAERFWEKVEKRGPDDCWEWQATIHRTGYGQFGVARGRMKGAHRIAYRLTHGSIPKGAHILHTCDNKRCVNPAHLRTGTNAENCQEAWDRGLQPRRAGEDLPWTRYTANEVREVRWLHSEGVSAREIARRYGMSHTNAKDIVRRRTWKHIA